MKRKESGHEGDDAKGVERPGEPAQEGRGGSTARSVSAIPSGCEKGGDSPGEAPALVSDVTLPLEEEGASQKANPKQDEGDGSRGDQAANRQNGRSGHNLSRGTPAKETDQGEGDGAKSDQTFNVKKARGGQSCPPATPAKQTTFFRPDRTLKNWVRNRNQRSPEQEQVINKKGRT